ncbi:MAG: phosphate ABC transporter permease [Desulfuromonas sp.]|nr:MAG: phosphate ABC transporter permease [Desulfuromonas sp.]
MNKKNGQEFDLYFGPEVGEGQYWRDLLDYRGLVYFLAWRDILVRYKQTIIGIAWSILNPLFFMVVLTMIFGRIGKFPTEGNTPYPLLVFSALLPWQLFSAAVAQAGKSLVENNHMVAKIYFPRILLPCSSIAVCLVDFAISFSLLFIMLVFYQWNPGWYLLALPVFLLFGILAALSIGIWLSAINVRYRDFQFIVPFCLQIGLFISPVGFASSVVPEQWRLLYSLNPMVGVIDGFRWCLMRGEVNIFIPGLVISFLVTAFMLWGGILYFRRTERTFADYI